MEDKYKMPVFHAGDESGYPRGASLISAERRRQIDSEGYMAESDDEWTAGELAEAALCYIRLALTCYARGSANVIDDPDFPPGTWPWSQEAYKPDLRDPKRNLIRAGALIAAEIDRLIRAENEKGED